MRIQNPGGTQALPPIVKNLIIINVIMALLQFVVIKTFHYNLQDVLALHYWRSSEFKPWQLITHIFMHGNPSDIEATVLHLFSNMFGLWMFGSVLEQQWGPKRFLIFYLICGVGAAICFMGIQGIQFEPMLKSIHFYNADKTLDHYNQVLKQLDIEQMKPFNQLAAAWNTDPGNTVYANTAARWFSEYSSLKIDVPMVGASGAIFGVLFAFGYLFRNTEIMLLFLPIPIKAKWMITFYALFELYAAFQNSADDNVAHVAHLGGMLFAFILLKFWLQRDRRRFY